MTTIKPILPLFGWALCLSSAHGATVTITGSANSVDITELTYERNGSTVVQGSSATSTTNTTDSILLQNAKINDGGTIKDLPYFNLGSNTVENVNFTNTTTGVGVIKNGAITSIEANGLTAYTAALTDTLNDTDINNYAFYDGVTNTPSATTADFDIMFSAAFRPGDYVAVAERDGNTFFELRALGLNGELIADADVLKFDSSTGQAGGYDWNTGFADTTYFSDQPQWMTIAKIDLFNTSTDIHGFRIDNNGNADVKFFGISDTPFDIVTIPEPSGISLLGLGSLGLLLQRRRIK